ncbi:MAG: sulfatase-like hydrolase/transferase [Gemmatimonadota bacterium]|nr:sulfatase-like hydrolase/transferase [Gemmatimonadota bacterium]
MAEDQDRNSKNLSRREFLAAASGVPAVLASGLSGCAKPVGPVKRPNILIIISDQLAQRAVGAYGDSQQRTPNIDSLASSGVRFSNAYTNCPLCQPSRASFWTGRLPHETGVTSNGMNYPVPPVPETMPTLGDIFTTGRYEAVNFGKRHDAGALRGFNLVDQKEMELEAPAAWPVNYDSKEDLYATDKCVEFLETRREKPFIAVASLNNPHNICGWVGHNAGVHQDVPVPEGDLPPLPDNFEIDDFQTRPLPVQYICCSHRRLEQASRWNETNYRHYLAAYYHYLGLVDTHIGRILEALYSTPAGRDTLVVFFSDHGDGMASHRMVSKQVSFYEETTRIPFVFSGAGVVGKDVVVDRPLVSLLDLAPTLCDFAGLDAPDDLLGRSMLPWIRGGNPGQWHECVTSQWQTEWGYTVSPGRMIRTGRYKYTRYLEGDGQELYNIVEDPGEKRNLVNDPACREVLKEHRALLDSQLERSRDPFHSLAVHVDKRWRSHTPGYRNHRGPSAPEAAWEEEKSKKST